MTLAEMKKKALSLIEELNPDSEYLTDDPDLQAKQNEVINQVMYEMARLKKIAKYVEMEISAGDKVTFADLERECGYEVYQIERVCGPKCVLKADGTVLKFVESGTAEIDLFVYPERITENTKDNMYEFELSPDALEIMPYGIAADLLKSDSSVNYGSVYAAEFERKIKRLDPRYHTGTIVVEGGVWF